MELTVIIKEWVDIKGMTNGVSAYRQRPRL